jgi:drug/metabolite transporter (DMT)-like permease
MLVLATLYWGVSFPLIKSITALTRALVPAAGGLFLGASAFAPRFAIAAAITLVLGWRSLRGVRPGELRQGVLLAIFGAGGSILQTDGIQYTDASASAFLTQLSAIFIPALLAVQSRRSPGARVWTACVLVLVGVAVLGHLNVHKLGLGRGEWETILCSLFFVGQILTAGRRRYAGNRMAVVTIIMFSVQAVVLGAAWLITAPSLGAVLAPWSSVPWVGFTLGLAVVCTVGAFSIMNTWQKRISATEAGLIYCIEPLFASVFALFLPALFSKAAGINYPDEHATWTLIVGGSLITVANIMVLTSSGSDAV